MEKKNEVVCRFGSFFSEMNQKNKISVFGREKPRKTDGNSDFRLSVHITTRHAPEILLLHCTLCLRMTMMIEKANLAVPGVIVLRHVLGRHGSYQVVRFVTCKT